MIFHLLMVQRNLKEESLQSKKEVVCLVIVGIVGAPLWILFAVGGAAWDIGEKGAEALAKLTDEV